MKNIETYPQDFEAWYKILAPSEGGISNRSKSADPAGLTNRGITIGTFKRVALPLLGVQPTEANLRILTSDQAKYIAYKEYWIKTGVPSALPLYRTILADSFFLGGGIKSLGYTTISSLNLAKPSLSIIAGNRLKYLKSLKNWEANKNGWSTRLQNIVGKSVKFTSENLGSSIIILLVLSVIIFISLKPK